MIQLCSKSERREQILQKFKIPFKRINTTLIKEPSFNGEKYRTFARMVAKLKGKYSLPQTDHYVLTADTIVVIDGVVLGKPNSLLNAIDTLHLLSGKTHDVITAICLTCPKSFHQYSRTSLSSITFSSLKSIDIANYVEQKKPLDKAGSYGIQEIPDFFIKNISGCFYNVMGLPIYLFLRMAKKYDIILSH